MIKKYLTYIKEDVEIEEVPMRIAPLLYAKSNYSDDVKRVLLPLLKGKNISFWYWTKNDNPMKGESFWNVGREDNVELKDIVVDGKTDNLVMPGFRKPFEDIYFIVGDKDNEYNNRVRLLHTNHRIEFIRHIRKNDSNDPYNEEYWDDDN